MVHKRGLCFLAFVTYLFRSFDLYGITTVKNKITQKIRTVENSAAIGLHRLDVRFAIEKATMKA